MKPHKERHGTSITNKLEYGAIHLNEMQRISHHKKRLNQSSKNVIA